MKLKNVYLVSAVATTLFFAACSKNDNNDNSNNATVNGQDTTFMLKASQSNRSEIELGTLALVKVSSDSVRNFAQKMVMDHTTALTDLRNLADSVNVTVNLSDSLDADQIGMRNTLTGLSGRAFDSAYINGQIAAHQKTLTLFNAEISSGQNTQVKGYASRNQPIIQTHINMADSALMHLQ
jgi:putative membrane protein